MARSLRIFSSFAALLLIASMFVPVVVSANQLLDRSLMLSDNQASAKATWKFKFKFNSADDVASLSFQICTNNPLPDTQCDSPVGMSFLNAALKSQTGNTGFSVSASTTDNRLILQRSGTPASLVDSTYELENVINPSSNGSYYVRVQSYDTSYTVGSSNNYGGIAFAIADNVRVQATVPPYLLFCVGVTVNGFDCENVIGDYVDFGELSSRQPTQGRTQMLAASNAIDGYTIRVNGPTLTSGNNIIDNMVGSDVSKPGNSQFGMNLRANSSPAGGVDVAGTGSGLPAAGYNQINSFRFNPGDVVAVSNAPDLARKYTSTYIVNVPASQAPGVYVSTLTYIALGSF